MIEFRIHGLGGQGIVTFSRLLSQAALQNGLFSQSLPNFGVERRGASVSASVRIDNQPILLYSQCQKPDYIVVMNKSQIQKAESMGIGEQTKFIINSEKTEGSRYDFVINATRIAADNGLMHNNIPYVNIPMFGIICKTLQFPRTSVEIAIRENWNGKNAEIYVNTALQAYDAI